MSFLDPDQFASMCESAEQTLVQTCEVSRVLSLRRLPSGETEDEPDQPAIAHTYPCRIADKTTDPIKIETGPGNVVMANWVVKLPLTADWKASDRLLVGSRRFEPIADDRDRVNATLLQVFCILARD